ncbi:TPA: hypothetical protein N0F65_008311, partial [Lagenidium giganteum]
WRIHRPGRKPVLAAMETIGRSVRASIDFNGPLNALSVSPNNKFIAVGGRDVLKVVALEASGFAEKRNLRVGKSNLNFSTNDIRWHPQSDSLVATAATNGAVVIWNLQREGFKNVQERVLNGHRRAVNRISWHATDWNLLLSGSQDGTIKLWDKRGKVSNTYQPKSESVRDVRFSIFQPNKFAVAFENGIVQVWDIRKNTQPEIKFTAHKGLVLALDWHPTKPNLIASGARDRYVKIWDLNGDMKQPKHTIQTIASVGRLAWRPNCADHIATCASLMDNSIHVWDVQHPCIPVASMKGHADIASGINWLDTPVAPSFGHTDAPSEWEGLDYWQHVLACSKDGTLKLHSLADSFKPHQSLPTTALALNSRGQMAFSHDYIDRSCSSLKIHRHFNLASALFTVTDAARDAHPTGKNSNSVSPFGSITATSTMNGSNDGLDDIHEHPNHQHTFRSTARAFGGGQPPPLPPKALHSHHPHGHPGANNANSSANTAFGNPSGASGNFKASGGAGGASTVTGGILRQSASSQNLLSLQANAMAPPSGTQQGLAMGGLDSSRWSGAKPVVSSTSSSPVLTFFTTANPRALVNLVSMQNVNKATQLEKIFAGDEEEFVSATQRANALREQYEHALQLTSAFGFDEDAFRFLAQHYRVVTDRDEDLSFRHMCSINALAAFVTGNAHLCQMWRILDLLYESEAEAQQQNIVAVNKQKLLNEINRQDTALRRHEHGEDGDNPAGDLQAPSEDGGGTTSLITPTRKDINEYHNHGNAPGKNVNQTMMLLEQLDHVNPQAMQGFDPYPYETNGRLGSARSGRMGSDVAMHYHQNKTSPMIVHGNAVRGELSHLRDAVLKELLEYYADVGDLQTCVAIAMVVSKITDVEKVVGKAWLQQIMMHYIDLLHQLQIYSTANELISNCNDTSIRQMNMKSTSVYFNCASCSKPFESQISPNNPSGHGSAAICANCNNVATRCSICHLPVRGLYVWCPVCSHGGHLEHMKDWFKQESVCPTGCSHRCSLNFVTSSPT